jgi:hypothetical protein
VTADSYSRMKLKYIKVDGKEYHVMWLDRGDHRHLKIFQGRKLVGFKNFALAVDTGDGVITWTIRAILSGVVFRNEFNKTKT